MRSYWFFPFMAADTSSIVLITCLVTLVFPLEKLENWLPPLPCLFQVSNSTSPACIKSCTLFLITIQFSIECSRLPQWESQCPLASYHLVNRGLRGDKWIGIMRWLFTSLGNNSVYEEEIRSNRILSVRVFVPFKWFSQLLDGLLDRMPSWELAWSLECALKATS